MAKDGTPQRVYEEKAEAAKAILAPHLHAGEFLHHCAYGVRPLSLNTQLRLSLLGIIGALVLALVFRASFTGRAGSGESIRLSTWLWFGVTAFLFYTLAKLLVVKKCVVGLTNQRLITVPCEADFSPHQVVEYRLETLSPVKTLIETEQATLEIHDPHKPFKAIFHQTDWADNLRQAVEMMGMLGRTSNRLTADGQTPNR